jgi:hypothetical protein
MFGVMRNKGAVHQVHNREIGIDVAGKCLYSAESKRVIYSIVNLGI